MRIIAWNSQTPYKFLGSFASPILKPPTLSFMSACELMISVYKLQQLYKVYAEGHV